MFLKSLNGFDPFIKFTHESNKESMEFFDIKVSLRNSLRKVCTYVYVKSTDRHQSLHYLPTHPYYTKNSLVSSQTLRISRLRSSTKDFENHKEEMKSWLRKTEYPEDPICSEMSKVKFSNLRLKSNDKNHNMKGKPLVVTYHPLLKPLSAIIAKNLSILHVDKEVKKVFTSPPMVSLRSARKLSSYLVRAKLYPLERMVGSYKCDSNDAKFAVTSRKQLHLLVVMTKQALR